MKGPKPVFLPMMLNFLKSFFKLLKMATICNLTPTGLTTLLIAKGTGLNPGLYQVLPIRNVLILCEADGVDFNSSP